MQETPRCPRCKSLVLAGRPFDLTEASFAAHTRHGDLPILVDFWAAWCGPCRIMAPVLDRMAGQRTNSLQVAKVDSDAQAGLAGRFNVRSIPTLILFRRGEELSRLSGAVDFTHLSRWLDAALIR
jgi:thioredoxin 2